MSNTLYSLKDLDSGDSIQVSDPRIILGREPSCGIVIDSQESSRRHALLEFQGGALHLEDLDSTNGTYLNDRRIRGRVPLEGGETIAIAGRTFLVITPEGGANRTIFGARIEDESSYILEQSSPNATSIRSRFPRPPGWTDTDTASLEVNNRAAREREMNERLLKAGIDHTVAAAALMVTSGIDDKPLLVIPEAGDEGRWSIGRSETCQLTIEHPTVSGHHADIVLSGGQWSIEDTDSTNGIKVNGKRRAKSKLGDGDRIKVGQVELHFRAL